MEHLLTQRRQLEEGRECRSQPSLQPQPIPATLRLSVLTDVQISRPEMSIGELFSQKLLENYFLRSYEETQTIFLH